MCTPPRHRRLVLAYDSNPSSDGSVLASATPPARHHHCLPTPLRPRPHPHPWQGFTRAPAQVQQQPVQQQPVQQRVITLAQAMGGRHVLQDGSLWTRPIGRPRVHPAPRRHSEARCNQWKHHRLKKKTDAALQAAQTALALYSEATRREIRMNLSRCIPGRERPRGCIVPTCTPARARRRSGANGASGASCSYEHHLCRFSPSPRSSAPEAGESRPLGTGGARRARGTSRRKSERWIFESRLTKPARWSGSWK